MPEMEKITTNVSVVDLGRIELLIENGFYASRTEFIRSAIRRQLDTHRQSLEDTVRRKAGVLGVLRYSAAELEERHARGEVLDITVIGMLVLADDIPVELAQATINSISVFGVFNAPDHLHEALAGRISA
jgi:Arc/MetJ-type ribon-helix-helix transcriptional regulator